jgi:hypothetical protein
MTSEAVVEKAKAALARLHKELKHTNVSSDLEAKLRAAFADE